MKDCCKICGRKAPPEVIRYANDRQSCTNFTCDRAWYYPEHDGTMTCGECEKARLHPPYPFPFRCCGNCQYGLYRPAAADHEGPWQCYRAEQANFTFAPTRQFACCEHWEKFKMPVMKDMKENPDGVQETRPE